ncbi:hypothetical protein XENTR_v10022345 [Xenopus tropicalis]|nr:hypothetical protein XENTR_v10022345 [Xenopus tropicalis]
MHRKFKVRKVFAPFTIVRIQKLLSDHTTIFSYKHAVTFCKINAHQEFLYLMRIFTNRTCNLYFNESGPKYNNKYKVQLQ